MVPKDRLATLIKSAFGVSLCRSRGSVTTWCCTSGSALHCIAGFREQRNPLAERQKNSTILVEFVNRLVLKRLRVEPELQFAAFGRQFCFPANLLGRRFKRPQTANFLHNALGIELVLQPFERSVDRLTFSHNHFRHKNPIIRYSFLYELYIVTGVFRSVNRSSPQKLSESGFVPRSGTKELALFTAPRHQYFR